MSGKAKQAVVLAGGKGTRLRPLTDTRPKPLLPVLGRPCVEYVVHSLAEAGVAQVFMACGYRSTDLVEAFGDGSDLGVELVFAFEEEPAGTAGAVKLLEDRLEGSFIVASGDVLADVDIAAMVEAHGRRGAFATMALTRVDSPCEFGIVGLDPGGRIERFKEKPAPEEVFSDLINAGIYVLEREALDHVPPGVMYDFSKDLFPRLMEMGLPLYGHPLEGLWKDIGRPRDLLDANLRMAERRGIGMEIEGASITGRVTIGDADVEGAEVLGPSFIDDGVLARGARISSSVVGRDVSLGQGAEVSSSLVLAGCSVGEGARIEDTILGEGCVIGREVAIISSVLADGTVIEGPECVEGRVTGKE